MLIIITPLVLILRFLIRPLALLLYRVSFPLRRLIGNRLAAARNRFLFPLTTRSVVHVIIGLITVVVSTNSLAAKEPQATESGHRTLLAQIVSPDAEEELTFIAVATPVAAASSGDLLFLDAGGGTDGATELDEEFTDVAALEPTVIVDTITAGQPRSEITRYTVKGGDTISTIGEKFAITQRSILWANNLSDSDYIKPGQELTIPPVSGVLHQVKSGDTLQGIANKYKANLEQILTFNRLAAAEAIETNQVLVIPGGEIDAPPPVVQPSQRFASAPNSPSVSTPPPSASSGGSGFRWPTVSRRINQGFKPYYHRALDIEGDMGGAIYAADSGRVESVSYQRYGYGYHVIINHGDGIKTLYAHAGKIFVKAGDSVNKGQTVASIGMTGRTTGPHLHFEVFKGGAKQNPNNYLY